MSVRTIGDLIREWRQRRRLTQLDLAMQAEISTRHLSFIENGRAVPSREMVVRLSEQMELPYREQNQLLLAAGHAPEYSEHSLEEPAFAPARAAVRQILSAHEPYPALAFDRHWNMIDANAAVAVFMNGVSPDLLEPPVNVLRVSLHPLGMASRIVNFNEWRHHLLARLRHQIAATGSSELQMLYSELAAYPAPESRESNIADDHAGIYVPLRLAVDGQILHFLSTVTTFGTPLDITLAEISIETFFPDDAGTARALNDVVTPQPGSKRSSIRARSSLPG